MAHTVYSLLTTLTIIMALVITSSHKVSCSSRSDQPRGISWQRHARSRSNPYVGDPNDQSSEPELYTQCKKLIEKINGGAKNLQSNLVERCINLWHQLLNDDPYNEETMEELDSLTRYQEMMGKEQRSSGQPQQSVVHGM